MVFGDCLCTARFEQDGWGTWSKMLMFDEVEHKGRKHVTSHSCSTIGWGVFKSLVIPWELREHRGHHLPQRQSDRWTLKCQRLPRLSSVALNPGDSEDPWDERSAKAADLQAERIAWTSRKDLSSLVFYWTIVLTKWKKQFCLLSPRPKASKEDKEVPPAIYCTWQIRLK